MTIDDVCRWLLRAPAEELACADRAGVKRDAVARWERNNREPSWGNVLALAAALGVECTAFTKAPADTTPAPRGRPRKTAPPEEQAPPAPPAEPPGKSKSKKGKRSGSSN
jgi:transcriptional regulator with XRE-family HTH domain